MGKHYLEQRFLQNQGLGGFGKRGSEGCYLQLSIIGKIRLPSSEYRSSLRLVVNLQDNVKAMQSEAYARKVKISNLQQMAETLVYVQEHGYGRRRRSGCSTGSNPKEDLETSVSQAEVFSSQMKTLNAQIHYTQANIMLPKSTYR